MLPLIIRGNLGRVVRVPPGNPFLIDRTGIPRIATTDSEGKVIRISETVPITMFDQVLMHEVTHATMVEYGVTDLLASGVYDHSHQLTEELMAWFAETHAIEIINAVWNALGRRPCTNGICLRGERQ